MPISFYEIHKEKRLLALRKERRNTDFMIRFGLSRSFLIFTVPLAFAVISYAGAPTCNPPSGQGTTCRSNCGAAAAATAPRHNARVSTADWNSPIAPRQTNASVQVPAANAPLVSPSTVDETFRGSIQLSISGIDVGSSVRVEKFQVNNSTGVIDADAVLEQSFLLTDGQSNVIGGVANPNVPADTTPADGSIVAQLSFLDRSVPTTVAEYVFQFSSPTNAFAPQTARFTVTAAPAQQHFTGTVTTNGTPVPYAHVVLLDTSGGGYDFVAAVVADAAGNYTLGADPGEYDLVAVKRGLIGAFGKGVGHTLGAGVDQPVNLAMAPGSRQITGQVRDLLNDQGLPAVQVVFRSHDGQFTVDYTNSAGNYATSIGAGEWDVEVERDAVNQIGYLAPSSPKSVDTTNGNPASVAFTLPKATSLFHGKVTDTNGGALAGVEMDAISEDGEFESYTATDANGNYVIAVNGGVWFFAPTSAPLQEKGYLSPDPEETFVDNAQAKAVDFSVTPSNAKISGVVQDYANQPIGDVTYRAKEISGGALFTTFASDDPDGTFSLSLTNGTWRITPDFDEAADDDLIFALPNDLTLSANQTLTGVDLRVQEPTHHVVVQIKDDNGVPYEGARVELDTTVNGNMFASYAFSDDNGIAELPALDGNWTLVIQGPELQADGFRDVANMNVAVKGSDVNVAIQLEPLPPTGNTLANLSTRGLVQQGEGVLIGGFVVTGQAPKKVLIRAIGPSLNNSGVNNALSDPVLDLFDSNSQQIATNDDWVNSADKQAIINSTVPPSNDKESAIIATLSPGKYTAKVSGVGGATGVALVELYDLDSFSSSILANISTRGQVNQGDDVLIAGYIVGGYKTQRVVVRAIGPSLSQLGVNGALADPKLELHDGQGTTIASNNDWQESQKQEVIDTTLAPTDPKESAIVADLAPGNYTAVVSGVGSTGIGLAEVYNITPR